jgi:transcription elongation factor Elf1
MTKEMNTHEFEELKKDVFKAKRDYMPQSVPTKIKKTGKDIYELTTKCPYCGQTATYKNCFLQNKNYFCTLMICRHCPKRFNITSFLYKFTMDYYLELDFFRKNFLLVRDKLLKKTI